MRYWFMASSAKKKVSDLIKKGKHYFGDVFP